MIRLRLSQAIEGQRKFKGQLLTIDGDDLVLLVDGEQLKLQFANVEKANLLGQI